MINFERDLNRAATRIEAQKPRSTLSARFNQHSQTAVETQADRNYYRGMVL